MVEVIFTEPDKDLDDDGDNIRDEEEFCSSLCSLDFCDNLRFMLRKARIRSAVPIASESTVAKAAPSIPAKNMDDPNSHLGRKITNKKSPKRLIKPDKRTTKRGVIESRRPIKQDWAAIDTRTNGAPNERIRVYFNADGITECPSLPTDRINKFVPKPCITAVTNNPQHKDMNRDCDVILCASFSSES